VVGCRLPVVRGRSGPRQPIPTVDRCPVTPAARRLRGRKKAGGCEISHCQPTRRPSSVGFIPGCFPHESPSLPFAGACALPTGVQLPFTAEPFPVRSACGLHVPRPFSRGGLRGRTRRRQLPERCLGPARGSGTAAGVPASRAHPRRLFPEVTLHRALVAHKRSCEKCAECNGQRPGSVRLPVLKSPRMRMSGVAALLQSPFDFFTSLSA
jgi:hypothetical protein